MTREREPMMSSDVTSFRPPLPSMMDFITYMGEVPISPYTIPMVTRNIPNEKCFFFIMKNPAFRKEEICAFQTVKLHTGIDCNASAI